MGAQVDGAVSGDDVVEAVGIDGRARVFTAED